MNRHYLCLLFVLTLMLPYSALGQQPLSITVSTDKQNYGLGQIIVFTVEVQQAGAPMAHTPVYYELRDSQNQTRANGLITTDDTGRYTKQITIGDDFPLGSYTVYVRVTVGSQTASATTTFQTIPEFPSDIVLLFTLAVGIGILGTSRKKKLSGKQALYQETLNVRFGTHGRLK